MAKKILVDFTHQHQRYVHIMMRIVGIGMGWSEDDMRALITKMPVTACKVTHGPSK